MGYFFRRSANFGPFRLNFSKAGIGASVGVKGARLTMTPRGTTYITVGKHGAYYRETLSSHHRRSASPVPPASETPLQGLSNQIVTADVSDLTDSSSEELIQQLNERANMFNPALILYAAVLILCMCALFVTVRRVEPQLPNPTSVSDLQRNIGTPEYAILVDRYGYPDSVLATELLGIVPLRTAYYRSANVKVSFVPNGCVQIYEDAMQILALGLRAPVLARDETKTTKHCIESPAAGWAVVGYVDPVDNSTISVDLARYRLSRNPLREGSPPIIEVKSATARRNANSRSRSKKQFKSKSEAPPRRQTWSVEGQAISNVQTDAGWNPFSGSTFLLTSLGLLCAAIIVHKKNTAKRTSRLFFELDEVQHQRYVARQNALAHLGQSQRIWRIEGKYRTSDWKYNAGASKLVSRSRIAVGPLTPPRIKTNVVVPCINIGSIKLFFLPDVILYWERSTFGAISYQDLRVERSLTRFVEDGDIPTDATVVDKTWRYVNKDGGPDRRFNNNTQLPVVQYALLILSSSHGLNIHLYTSNFQEGLAFANCWNALQDQIKPIEMGEQSTSGSRDLAGATQEAFRVLGLNADASLADISAAYRHLAQMYHPDKVAGLAPEFRLLADNRMKEINAAYEALKRLKTEAPPRPSAPGPDDSPKT
ncbi:MAG TPA: DUF4236 domain-containing protein [Bryobacteraceae bacterium]|nr:DUF4236 domain-containing protein [Bryobacteraceae bacterium]